MSENCHPSDDLIPEDILDRILPLIDEFDEAWRLQAEPNFVDWLRRGAEADRPYLLPELVRVVLAKRPGETKATLIERLRLGGELRPGDGQLLAQAADAV